MKHSNIILSIAYLPPAEYFFHIINSNEVLIERHEHYVKQTYRNRCNIYSPNGVQSLSIPVGKPDGNKTDIDNIIISNHSNWQIIHWRAIETAYNSSPFFLFYKDELYPFYAKKYNKLLEFNMSLLSSMIELLGINKKVNLTESYIAEPGDMIDYRSSISPKQQKNNHGTESFLSFPTYRQVFSDKSGFKPNLSIIDLLFNLGPSATEYLNKSRYL